MRLHKSLLSLALASLCAFAQAPTDIRVVLVIGNGAYTSHGALANPVNDAKAMAKALLNRGFEVIELQDANQAQMRKAIDLLEAKLKGKRGVGMLYYAGHGVQFDWHNFMIPVDAKLKASSDIPQRTVDISSVLEKFKQAGNRLNILVLDACRDNPFDNTLATKGLAPVDAPLGTFIAYATAAGNVAEDGDEKSTNGLYTRYLIEEMNKPATRLEDTFKRVRLQVQQKSAGRQVPIDVSNLDEGFSFDGGFLNPTPETATVREQRYNLEREAWQRIKDSHNASDFFDFLKIYPNGFISEIAQFRADQLQKLKLVTQPRADGVVVLASGKNRYQLGDQYILQSTDLITKISKQELQKVTLATDERVEINGGTTIYDQMGGLIKDDSGVKNPPMLLVPSDLSLGKQWRSVFQNRIAGFDAATYINFRAQAIEDIEVGGNKVKTFKVDMNGYASASRGAAQFVGTLWIDPQTMRFVRYERTIRVMGHLVDNTRQEVLSVPGTKS